MSDVPPTHTELEACVRVLESVERNRGLLAQLDQDMRTRLLVAAGRVSRPDHVARRTLARAFRRRDGAAIKAADEALLAQTGARVLRREAVYPTPAPALNAPSESHVAPVHESLGELATPRDCYVCKRAYRQVHAFYDGLCPPCAELNYAKRHQTANLRGRVALLTGGRVKIGYHAGIKLLRAGARVVVTTRFPRDAAARYAREPDFAAWADRLEIYGLDLRHLPSVEAFADHLGSRLERLDVVIHNACQTVRRPPSYYAHLLACERASDASLTPEMAGLLSAHHALCRRRGAPGIALAAERTQLALTPGDLGLPGEASPFPMEQLDADLQQVDLRATNSWRLTLAEVPTVEALEVLLANAAAPFVLNARLKPLLQRVSTRDAHIVNVSAMEGQFARAHKTDKHPHTNMAKAALNMMTRTSAQDYVKDGIHMNCVDTGWVTDEDPAGVAQRKAHQQGGAFHPPLDVVDGAARIVDPVFDGYVTGEHRWGLFFKDYAPAPW